MMPTAIQRAKIVVQIGELEKEKKRLEEKLRGERSANLSAWSTYGSESCAGEMVKKEHAIHEEIVETESALALLKDCLDGNVDLAQKAPLCRKIGEKEKEIQKLQAKKLSFERELGRIERVESFLRK